MTSNDLPYNNVEWTPALRALFVYLNDRFDRIQEGRAFFRRENIVPTILAVPDYFDEVDVNGSTFLGLRLVRSYVTEPEVRP